MKYIVMLSAALLVAGCIHRGQTEATAGAKSQDQDAESRRAAALTGRTAGTPQDCIGEFDLGSQETYGRHAILFTSRNDDVVYVNRPPAGCPGLSYGQGIKVRTPMSRLCRGDVVTVFDPVSKMDIGGCGLGPFTPYRRTVTAKNR